MEDIENLEIELPDITRDSDEALKLGRHRVIITVIEAVFLGFNMTVGARAVDNEKAMTTAVIIKVRERLRKRARRLFAEGSIGALFGDHTPAEFDDGQ